jgi:predicted Zn-dependent protease
MAVWEDTQYVLARQPGHPRALSYQALVRMSMGQSDVAVKMLKQALAKDPDLFEGYLHLALVQTRAGHDKEAEAAIAEATRRFPERADMLARVLPEIRASGKAEGSTGADTAVAAGRVHPRPEAGGGRERARRDGGRPAAKAGAPRRYGRRPGRRDQAAGRWPRAWGPIPSSS